MKYSTHNLHDCPLPLPVPTKLVIDFRPGGVLVDYAPVFYSADPEGTVDEIVKSRGWDKRPGYKPEDVWVDGAF